MNLQGHKYDHDVSIYKSMQTKLFVALSLLCLDSARVWFSCQTNIGYVRMYGFCKSNHVFTFLCA